MLENYSMEEGMGVWELGQEMTIYGKVSETLVLRTGNLQRVQEVLKKVS
jgi:hypothetical protein